MIINNLPPIFQSNQSTVVSKIEPDEMTPSTWGGGHQPPPNVQGAESVTYMRSASNIESPTSLGEIETSDSLTRISIKV
jgi:hypothetical protein